MKSINVCRAIKLSSYAFGKRPRKPALSTTSAAVYRVHYGQYNLSVSWNPFGKNALPPLPPMLFAFNHPCVSSSSLSPASLRGEHRLKAGYLGAVSQEASLPIATTTEAVAPKISVCL